MALTLTVLAANLFGDAIRDVLDPQLRGRLEWSLDPGAVTSRLSPVHARLGSLHPAILNEDMEGLE